MGSSSLYRLVLVCAASLSLTPLAAQSDLASVTGAVTDSAHAAIAGVKVTIRNIDTNIARTMATNEDGYFTITSLPSGPYELIAETQAFHPYHLTDILIDDD